MMIIWRFSTRPFISYSPYTPAVSGGATWRSIRQQAGVLYAIPVIELWVKNICLFKKLGLFGFIKLSTLFLWLILF